MNNLVVIFLLFFSVTVEGQILQGTYYDVVGEINPEEPFHMLMVYENDSNALYYYFEGNRGAPSYNLGNQYERLIYNPVAQKYYNVPVDDVIVCSLEFTVRGDTVVVKTISGDCGFGYGVYADATYYIKDKNRPNFFIDPHNHKIYFNKMSPEQYRDFPK